DHDRGDADKILSDIVINYRKKVKPYQCDTTNKSDVLIMNITCNAPVICYSLPIKRLILDMEACHETLDNYFDDTGGICFIYRIHTDGCRAGIREQGA